MKAMIKLIGKTLSIIGLSMIMTACQQDEPNDSPYVDPRNPSESTVLIYAVATNSLSGNLVSDKNEMLEAAKDIDLDKNNVLIFQTVYEFDNIENKYTGKGEVSLIKLVHSDIPGEYEWQTIKKYSDEVASLNPKRVTEVIDYMTSKFKAESYGIVFWSHSTASQPYFKNPTTLPMQYSFGQDKTTPEEEYEQINIDVLAEAIPDNLFEYIWFDSCYMSNIESIYQLRNKCKYYVGYPTEVLEYGLPYDIVLPSMIGKNPDLKKAAQLFYDYYSRSFATVAVLNMTGIEDFAQYCKGVFDKKEVAATQLTKYSRGTTGPFYDLGDYAKEMSSRITHDSWEETLSKFVIYKATTRGTLLGLPIDEENYSGISTHLYTFVDNSEKEEYYKSLDWYKAVFN